MQFLYSTHFQVIQLSNTTSVGRNQLYAIPVFYSFPSDPIKQESYELFTQEAYGHVQTCRQHIQPLATFREQLSRWEAQVLKIPPDITRSPDTPQLYSWQQQYNVGTDVVMQLSMLLALGVLKFHFVTEFFHVKQLQPAL